jgi:hypothetical protein
MLTPMHREVKQWSGKEMRNLARFLSPCLAIVLSSPPTASVRPWNEVLECVNGLVNFNLMCQYRQHTIQTIGFMQEYLAQFHRHRGVFDEFRASATGKKKAAAAAKAHSVAIFGADVPDLGSDTSDDANARGTNGESTPEEDAEILTAARIAAVRNARVGNAAPRSGNKRTAAQTVVLNASDKEYLREYQRELTADTAHYNLVKLHLLGHFAETIPMYGSIVQYSTEASETLHKEVKNAFKRAVDEKQQIALNLHRKYMLRMRELNIISLAKQGVNKREVQAAMNLYSEKSERLAVAKAKRLGLSQTDIEARLVGLHSVRARYHGAVDDDGNPIVEGDALAGMASLSLADVDTPDIDEPAHEYIPELFGTAVSHRGWQFKNNVIDTSLHDIDTLAVRYRSPGLNVVLLRYLTQHYRDQGREFARDTLRIEHVGDLAASAYGVVELATRAFQSDRDTEVQRAYCSGQKKFRGRLRNDSVFYAKAEQEASCGDFGRFKVGRLMCLFTVQIPKPEEWIADTAAPSYHTSKCDVHQLIFAEQLNYENGGIMDRHSEIGFCKPANLANVGVILRINQLERIAHLIPAHGPDVDDHDVEASERRWAVNNRVDLYSFNEMYAGLSDVVG